MQRAQPLDQARPVQGAYLVQHDQPLLALEVHPSSSPYELCISFVGHLGPDQRVGTFGRGLQPQLGQDGLGDEHALQVANFGHPPFHAFQLHHCCSQGTPS